MSTIPEVGTINTPNSPVIPVSIPAFSRCGDFLFFVKHSGIRDSETDLFIYDKDGIPLVDDNHANTPGLQGLYADREIQICAVPGKTDEWYILYNEWHADAGAPAGNGVYSPSRILYSRVKYNGDIMEVKERDEPVNVNGSEYTYTQGKAISIPDENGDQYFYGLRRANNSGTFSVDKFIIKKDKIEFKENSGVMNGTFFYLTFLSSRLIIDSQDNRIAVLNYNENQNLTDIFVLFTDFTKNTEREKTAVSGGDLILQPDNEILFSPMKIEDVYEEIPELTFLQNMEKKITPIEFSPDGKYLYFANGGYVYTGITHVSYIGQIDLSTTAPNYDLRLAAQIPPGPFNYITGAGGSISQYGSAFHRTVDIQKARDGMVYFTKSNTNTLFCIGNPDDPIEQMLIPGEIDLSKEHDNIYLDGNFHYMPDGIDGFDYFYPLEFDLGKDTCILEGESIRIFGPEEYATFLWHDGSTNEFFDATEEGMVIVKAFDHFGCSYSDSLFVNEVDANDVFIGNDTIVCNETAIELDAGDGFLSYEWQDGSTEQTFLADSAGIFWVEVETGCGSVRDSINIEVGEAPEFNLGADTTICHGDYILLQGPPSQNYLWQNGDTDPIQVIRENGIYWLEVSDETGCTFRDSLYLTTSQPSLLLPPDTMICDNDSILLIAGTSIFYYEWFDGSTDTCMWAYIQGAYSVTATDSLGCTATEETNINHINSPVVDLGRDTGFCDYDTFTFFMDEPYTTYIWNGNDTSQVFIPSSGGEFFVTATNRCGESSDTIILEKYFSPEVYLGPDTVLFPGQELLLNAGPGYLSYLWSNGNTEPSIYINEPGEYFVSIWNEHCKATDTIEIKRVSPFRVPNVFTPNNDGYNDDFEILGEYIDKFFLVILNRWGETLYQTNDINLRWDGTFHGRQCAEGVYFWIIRYQYPTEKTPTTIQGTVTIVTD
jgi:gliding motility-associated-like protein